MCLLFEHYPYVFEAWRALLLERMGKGRRQSFQERREATRAQRLAKIARRK